MLVFYLLINYEKIGWSEVYKPKCPYGNCGCYGYQCCTTSQDCWNDPPCPGTCYEGKCVNGMCVCKQAGESCTATQDCCWITLGLYCGNDGRCTTSCSKEGELCYNDNDCCYGLTCSGGFCRSNSGGGGPCMCISSKGLCLNGVFIYDTTTNNDVIQRPLVMLIHGRNANCTAWNDYFQWLKDRQVRTASVNLLKNEGNTGTASFQNNANSINSYFNIYKNFSLQKWPSANQNIVAIGHSRGGLELERAAYVNKTPFSGVITLGTPFWGTPLGEFCMAVGSVINPFICRIFICPNECEGSWLYPFCYSWCLLRCSSTFEGAYKFCQGQLPGAEDLPLVGDAVTLSTLNLSIYRTLFLESQICASDRKVPFASGIGVMTPFDFSWDYIRSCVDYDGTFVLGYFLGCVVITLSGFIPPYWPFGSLLLYNDGAVPWGSSFIRTYMHFNDSSYYISPVPSTSQRDHYYYWIVNHTRTIHQKDIFDNQVIKAVYYFGNFQRDYNRLGKLLSPLSGIDTNFTICPNPSILNLDSFTVVQSKYYLTFIDTIGKSIDLYSNDEISIFSFSNFIEMKDTLNQPIATETLSLSNVAKITRAKSNVPTRIKMKSLNPKGDLVFLLYRNQKPAILKRNKFFYLKGDEIKIDVIMPYINDYKIKGIYYDIKSGALKDTITFFKINDSTYRSIFSIHRRGLYGLLVHAKGSNIGRTFITVFIVANDTQDVSKVLSLYVPKDGTMGYYEPNEDKFKTLIFEEEKNKEDILITKNAIILPFKANEYFIYKMDGSLIKRGTIMENKIDISELKRGVYILKVKNKTWRFLK